MAIDTSKWTEADTDLVDRGVVTMADLEAWGGSSPTQVASLKSSGAQPGQGFFAPGDFSNLDPNAQVFQDSRAYDAKIAQNNATNDRYGSDLSWLDPSFQQNPAMLGQSAGSQTYANPQDVAAQQSAYNGLGSMVGKDMGYAGSGQQQGMFNQWGGVASGQGAPQFQSGAQQQQLLSQIGSLQNPTWGSDAQQRSTYGQVAGMSGPQFGTSADQQGVMDSFAARTRGVGQPDFNAGNGGIGTLGEKRALQGYTDRASGQGAPQFNSDADQRSVLNQLAAVAKSGGGQGLNLDNGARQEEQYGQLNDIVQGGGASKIEMANRQAQRMDQEQWLRSQREADQKAAESRGMSGSGSELLSIAADRQAAAGRNSLADLQTAAQLEERRLGAINSAGALAGTMRGQTNDAEFGKAARGDNALMAQGSMANQLSADDYRNKSYLDQSKMAAMQGQLAAGSQLSADDYRNKSYEDQTRMAALQSQGGMANQLRQAAYQEGMGTTQSELAKYGLQGDLANQMRAQQYQEQAFQAGYGLDKLNSQANISAQDRAMTNQGLQYNDTRALNAMQQQTNLANQLRSDQFNESNATRGYDLQALGAQGSLASNMRNASSQEGQFRANSADQFSQLNQSAYNQAAANNANFMQNSYQSMMNNRQVWEQNKLQTGVNVAGTIQKFDDNQNASAYNAAAGMANNNAGAFNTANANANAAGLAAATGGNAQVLAAQQAQNQAVAGGYGQIAGKFGDTLMTLGGGPGGAAGGAGAAPTGQTGSLASNPGTTWAGGGAPMGDDKNRFVY